MTARIYCTEYRQGSANNGGVLWSRARLRRFIAPYKPSPCRQLITTLRGFFEKNSVRDRVVVAHQFDHELPGRD
jgi:hypothetical protein